jgi:hypothetical protein
MCNDDHVTWLGLFKGLGEATFPTGIFSSILEGNGNNICFRFNAMVELQISSMKGKCCN